MVRVVRRAEDLRTSQCPIPPSLRALAQACSTPPELLLHCASRVESLQQRVQKVFGVSTVGPSHIAKYLAQNALQEDMDALHQEIDASQLIFTDVTGAATAESVDMEHTEEVEDVAAEEQEE
eukprot:NODE_7197_length_468_cov_58.916468_g6377_i0.p2 GENE.NODE_7197_length_468_cov_58.916468_g6377_i0~~NODE_7197_length_468_cov_58.916468_g6377_i0.p2  ORF type:complete len:140 (-),score=48.20 NODE_7197_length_468_cov_58.916468_g6377_i0:49-414(-)